MDKSVLGAKMNLLVFLKYLISSVLKVFKPLLQKGFPVVAQHHIKNDKN